MNIAKYASFIAGDLNLVVDGKWYIHTCLYGLMDSKTKSPVLDTEGPKDGAEEPEDTAEEPKDMAEELKDTMEEPKDTAEEADIDMTLKE